MVCGREAEADGGCEEEEGENEIVGQGDPGVSAVQVMKYIPLPEQEGRRGNEVRVNVDGFVVDVSPAEE